MRSEERTALAVIFYVLLIAVLIIFYVACLQSKLVEVFASIILLTLALLMTLYFNKVEPLKDLKIGDEFKRYEGGKNFEDFKIVYEQISNEIRGRDNLTIIAGSIMVSASLILLGVLADMRLKIGYTTTLGLIIVIAIMSIFTIWFICFNMTSRQLNRIDYACLHKMEEAREFKLHRLMREKIENENWWKYLRRPVWLYFFYLLTSACILLLLV